MFFTFASPIIKLDLADVSQFTKIKVTQKDISLNKKKKNFSTTRPALLLKNG